MEKTLTENRTALIVAGKLVQDHEFIYPFYRLQEAAMSVHVAVRGMETVYGALGARIDPTCDIAGLEPGDFDILVIPGGAKAMEYMRQDQELLDFIAAFHASGRPIACICHGAQLLISAGLVRGRRVSGYYSIKDDITNAGGQYVDAPSVVDGCIVTSPHYRYLGDWMRASLSLLESAEVRRPAEL